MTLSFFSAVMNAAKMDHTVLGCCFFFLFFSSCLAVVRRRVSFQFFSEKSRGSVCLYSCRNEGQMFWVGWLVGALSLVSHNGFHQGWAQCSTKMKAEFYGGAKTITSLTRKKCGSRFCFHFFRRSKTLF